MASITLSQVRTVNSNGTYSVACTVTASVGIPTQIFVYSSSLSTYDHVASLFDLQAYPLTLDTTLSFYRQSSATVTFPDVATATAAAANIKTAVSDLVTAYGAAVTHFPGSDTTTYTG